MISLETAGRIPIGQKGRWSVFTSEMKFLRWCDLPSQSSCAREAQTCVPPARRMTAEGTFISACFTETVECTPVCAVSLGTIVPLSLELDYTVCRYLGIWIQANHIHTAQVWGSRSSMSLLCGKPWDEWIFSLTFQWRGNKVYKACWPIPPPTLARLSEAVWREEVETFIPSRYAFYLLILIWWILRTLPNEGEKIQKEPCWLSLLQAEALGNYNVLLCRGKCIQNT